MAIDPNAMYRAGFARGTTGRNPQVERQVARQEKLINFAYDAIGKVATTAVSDGYKSFQKFRDQLDSPMSASLTQIDKLPKENAGLRQTIQTISDNYRKANRKAHLSFGKKRRAAKAERQKWMTQMTDLNAALETYKVNAEKAQGMARVFTGVAGENNKGGNVNLNPGNQDFSNLNTAEAASGEMAQLLRWNMDGGYMEVARNGSWVDGQYKDKNIKDNKELNKKYDTYRKAFEKKQNDINNDQGFIDTSPSAQVQSYTDWAATQDQSSITYKKYSDLRFGDGEDNTMENDLTEFRDTMVSAAYKNDAIPWSLLAENKKKQFVGKINSYSDAAFRDFYFGGYSYDYSNNRMDETAPAYQELLSRGLTPYSNDWNGALTTLKTQSMVKGSVFRQNVIESEWQNMENSYNNAQTEWQKLQAEKDRKAAEKGGPNYKPYQNYTVDGYTGIDYNTAKQQYDNMLVIGKVNYDRSKGYKYITKKGGVTEVYIQDVNDKSATYGKYNLLETIPTNDALARRGLDLFGEGFTGEMKDDDVVSLYLDSQNPDNAGADSNNDGIPDAAQPEISNLQR